MKLISLSINVDLIDKSQLIQGKKGRYLPLTIALNEEADQFGNNASAWLSQSKQQREAKENRLYFGNGKIVYDSDIPQDAEVLSSKQPEPDDLHL